MRFVFTPPGDATAGLVSLPWREPLAQWRDDRLLEIRNRGLSRHVVRFVAEAGEIFALKELDERLARREYHLLRQLARLGVRAVEPVGVVVDRPDGQDAVLVTTFLDYSIPYRALFAHPRLQHPTGIHPTAVVAESAVLGRNVVLGAYTVVDGEKMTMAPGDFVLTPNWTWHDHGSESAGPVIWLDGLDLPLARMLEGIFFEPYAEESQPLAKPLNGSVASYGTSVLLPTWQRSSSAYSPLLKYAWTDARAALMRLGPEVDVGDGYRLRITTRVAEPGHHRQLLFTRTGLVAQENQARRLLNDIAGYRAHLEQTEKQPVREAVAANRWLAEIYDPVIAAIPPQLRGRLDDAQIFHEILEHRWFLSETTGRDVGTVAAMQDYFARVLPSVPEDLTLGP